jgi:hypothetical protein
MKTYAVQSLIILAAASTWSCASSKPVPAPPPPSVAEVEKQDSPTRIERSNTVQVTAAVTAIDQEKRLVTLKDSDGKEETIEVGPEVRNLAQVHRGDHVVVSYLESVVFQLHKPGEAEPGVAVAGAAGRAEPGEKPGAVGAHAVKVTATVMAVDKKKPSLTLKTPDGETVVLPVRDAKRLDPVKVGDLLEITYQRAVAISVEKPQN